MTTFGLDEIEAEDKIEAPLTRAERLSRVILLCSNALHCLAVWEACLDGRARPLLSGIEVGSVRSRLWRKIHANSADVAVLDWCKLFDGREQHSWQKIVSDQARFEEELLTRANFSSDRLAKMVKATRRQRDKFVAHLDDKRAMFLPLIEDLRMLLMTLYTYMVAVEGAMLLDNSARTWDEVEKAYEAMRTDALETMLADLARRQAGDTAHIR